MTAKIVRIEIPEDKVLPDIIQSFSLEENYWMLKIGSESLNEARKFVSSLSNDEIFKKVEDEFNNEINKLNNNIIIEKNTSLMMQEKITKLYETQIENLNKKLENALVQIETYKQGTNISLYEELNKVKEKYELMYREKEKQVERLTDIHEKMIVQYQSTKSNSHKGSEGEKKFEEYANVFIDFKGFEIIDKHTQGGEGDFHLHFEEFDVLVDAKNYKKKVPNDQREKIKKDLQKNEHLSFGWLVSLNTSIEKWDKSPIMYEWINTKQCLVYINNLSEFNDPRKILRIVWFTCKEIYNMTREINIDEEELTKLRDDRFKMMDKIRLLRKNIREINTSMNATSNLIKVMDDELRLMLENETNELVNSNISLFDEWWDQNIEITTQDVESSSTDLWTKFKQDNKTIMNDMNITSDKFKQYLKTKVPMSAIILRNKNANGAFDIKGIKLKSIETETLEKMDVEIIKNIVEEKKKKVVKKKQDAYFDDELDGKIINDYKLGNDIMLLSVNYNIRPWQVVSVLMKRKIIMKRDDAKGYDIYKKTDEYKQKIKNT
jgi:hypothetical protein